MLRGLIEYFFCNCLVIEDRKCDIVRFRNRIKGFDIVRVPLRVETLDQGIEDSIPDAESLYTPVYSCLPAPSVSRRLPCVS